MKIIFQYKKNYNVFDSRLQLTNILRFFFFFSSITGVLFSLEILRSFRTSTTQT